ncbi:hypothetical protein MTO96_020749 [Rhipicephalus appendiculatus]
MSTSAAPSDVLDIARRLRDVLQGTGQFQDDDILEVLSAASAQLLLEVHRTLTTLRDRDTQFGGFREHFYSCVCCQHLNGECSGSPGIHGGTQAAQDTTDTESQIQRRAVSLYAESMSSLPNRYAEVVALEESFGTLQQGHASLVELRGRTCMKKRATAGANGKGQPGQPMAAAAHGYGDRGAGCISCTNDIESLLQVDKHSSVSAKPAQMPEFD